MTIHSIAEVLERARKRELIRHARLGAPPISPKEDEEAEHLARAVKDLCDELAKGGAKSYGSPLSDWRPAHDRQS